MSSLSYDSFCLEVQNLEKNNATFFVNCLDFKFRRNKCLDYIYDLFNYFNHVVILANEIICPKFWDRYLSCDEHFVYTCTKASLRNMFLQQCHSFCNNENDVRWSRCSGFCRKLILLSQSTFAPYIHIYAYIHTTILVWYSLHWHSYFIIGISYMYYIPCTMNALVRLPSSFHTSRKRAFVTLWRVL